MWEKFKNSNFSQKFKEGWKRGGAVVTVFCLVLALAVILSVSIATNRAKKKYGEEEGTTESRVEQNTERPSQNGERETEANKPSGKDEGETQPVGAPVEEFELSLPVNGVLSKGHDATIQVWSSTMEDYRVHLGVDIVAARGEPVYAAADGEVTKVWDDPLMGRCVAVSHGDDIFTYYKNLDVNLCEGITQGAKLKSGDQIGKVGETAILELADEPHLHLEMTVGGLAVDPRDYFSDAAAEVLKSDTSYESSAVGEEVTEDIKTGK